MRNGIVGFSMLVAVIAISIVGWPHLVNGEKTTGDKNVVVLKAMREKLTTLEQELAEAKAVSEAATAKALESERANSPGLLLREIVEKGGDGSVFYQLSGTTKKSEGAITEAGPDGFTWSSSTKEAVAAAEARRGK